jgi:hypothetical protein
MRFCICGDFSQARLLISPSVFSFAGGRRPAARRVQHRGSQRWETADEHGGRAGLISPFRRGWHGGEIPVGFDLPPAARLHEAALRMIFHKAVQLAVLVGGERIWKMQTTSLLRDFPFLLS